MALLVEVRLMLDHKINCVELLTKGGIAGLDGAEKPENCLFFVASVPAGIYSDCGQLTTLTPSFDCEWGNAKYFCNFFNC